NAEVEDEVEDEVNINETNNEEIDKLLSLLLDSVYTLICIQLIVSGGGDKRSFLWQSDTGEQICKLQ
ncbi:45378_t:CDS:2, partial [Gigaspora margarita]